MMGTFHSFISQPYFEEQDAISMLDKAKAICNDDRDEFMVLNIGKKFVVVGVLRNLGGPPFDLMGVDDGDDWATVSDERDFLNSK